MKYCQFCGKAMPDDAVFCPNCGGSNAGNAAPVSTPVTPPAPPVYLSPAYQQPTYQLKTNRGLLKFILLSIITFGIYGIVILSQISEDINTVASKYDGKKTMHYCLVLFVFSWLTLGIVPLVWQHRISARMGRELTRRGIGYSFGAGTFWGWGILGALIVVGPFIYCYKFFKSMNFLAADYNLKG